MTLTGVLPVLYSFYRPDGALDLDANTRQIDYALACGANGITLLGLASEGELLTAEERLSAVRAAAIQVPRERNLLITLRSDDDVDSFARAVLDNRTSAAFICQVGADARSALEQCRALHQRYPAVICGLQLAPGLIEGSTVRANVLRETDIEISFIKAEYNSIDLSNDLARLDEKLVLLVGKHGLNILEYLRIGAAGVIPGTEMTARLVDLLHFFKSGQLDEAFSTYRILAPYVDFAMQDLSTVVAVGRVVTGTVLGLSDSGCRRATDLPTEPLREAVSVWGRYWTDKLSQSAI